MSQHNCDDLVQKAESLYEQRLKDQLEPSHQDAFVSIEPESGDYFLGDTLSDAVNAARRVHPDRLVHTLRVGHKVTVHMKGNTYAA